MTELGRTLNELGRLTKVLADEIHEERNGPILDLLKIILNNIETPIGIITSERKLLYFNPTAQKFIGRVGIDINDYIGKRCEDFKICDPDFCKVCPVHKVLESRQVETKAGVVGRITGNPYTVTCIPLIYNGISGMIVIFGRPLDA